MENIERKFNELVSKIDGRAKRYKNLLYIIKEIKPHKLLEIGVYDGKHSLLMIETAKLFNSNIEYFGFDLFEDLTKEKFKEEFSKKSSTEKDVFNRLSSTKVKIKLFKGDTIKTLPLIKKNLPKMDFIFIDGGHSELTIKSDWENIQSLIHENTIIIFDDFYTKIDAHIKNKGCQNIIKQLDSSKFKYEILNIVDTFSHFWGTLYVNFVKVQKK